MKFTFPDKWPEPQRSTFIVVLVVLLGLSLKSKETREFLEWLIREILKHGSADLRTSKQTSKRRQSDAN